MLKIFIVLFVCLSTYAFADTKLSFTGSVNYNTVDVDNLDNTTVIDEKSGVGFGVGLRALMGLNDQLHFRSGAGLVYKVFGYELDSGVGKEKLDFSAIYLNVPLTLYWKASPQVGFFGGTALQAKLDDDCDSTSPCRLDKDKTLVFPAVVGFDFTFAEKLGMEISYEYGMTETAKDVKVHTAVVSFLYHLD